MTDAHCHLSCGEASVREFLVGRDFFGVHPWETATWTALRGEELRAAISAAPRSGVGEIGLDRLRSREIPETMRAAFQEQLEIAAEFSRPVVLHGAKCWGEVVRACRPFAGRIPAFLFHGFSRSDGLLPDIVALNGYISVGPAVLNDHAINYRALVKKIPPDRLLVETDRTVESAAECPTVREVLAGTAALRAQDTAELEAITDANAARFIGF